MACLTERLGMKRRRGHASGGLGGGVLGGAHRFAAGYQQLALAMSNWANGLHLAPGVGRGRVAGRTSRLSSGDTGDR